jgi:hypothetical protein
MRFSILRTHIDDRKQAAGSTTYRQLDYIIEDQGHLHILWITHFDAKVMPTTLR